MTLVLPLVGVTAAPKGTRLPVGTHIPQRPFVLPPGIWESVFAATTPSGKILSAEQLTPLVVFAKWPMNFIETRVHWNLKIGVFLLNVRSDGTVSDVEILQSIGHPTANKDCVSAFKQWRFRPNSVKEVRVPACYSRVY
jgi:TonB family protein